MPVPQHDPEAHDKSHDLKDQSKDQDDAGPSEIASGCRGGLLPITGPQYWVAKKIGQGAFGVVYSGIRLSDSMAVAIKFVNLSCELDDRPLIRDQQRGKSIIGLSEEYRVLQQLKEFGRRL